MLSAGENEGIGGAAFAHLDSIFSEQRLNSKNVKQKGNVICHLGKRWYVTREF